MNSIQYRISSPGPIDQASWSFNKERVEKWNQLSAVQKTAYVVRRFFIHCHEWFQFYIHQVERFWCVEGRCDRFIRSRALNRIFTKTVLGKDDSYKKAVQELRNEIKKTPILSQRKAAAFFTNKKVFLQMLPEFLASTGLRQHPVTSLASFVRAYQRLSLRTTPQLRRSKELFDPLLFGNIPYVWQKLPIEGGRTVDLVRMPTPTIDTRQLPLKSAPSTEFRSFISSLKAEGKRHLYVNLMNMEEAHEKVRSCSLKEYARSTGGTLSFLHLDKNSSFYKQVKTPQKQSQEDFFQKFRATMKDPVLNELPSCLTAAVLDGVFSSARLRCSSSMLSRHERAVLIDLVHTELIQKAISLISPQSVNVSCKNCIDRGIAQQVELVAKYRLEHGLPVFTEDLSAVTFAPSLFVSNRPMNEGRFVRLVSVLDRLVHKE